MNSRRGPPNVRHVITSQERWPPNVHHSVTYHYVLPWRGRYVTFPVLYVIYGLFLLLDCGFGWSVTSLRSFPASRGPGERSLYISGVLRFGDPDLYFIYCLFRMEYELIFSSVNCHCILPRRVRSVTSSRSFPTSRWLGDRPLCLSVVL